MSMINISGIPNLGIPAMGGFPQSNPSQGLNNAQTSYAGNQNYFGDQARTIGAANSYDPWANTPGGFGAQTAAYSGLGAAYGRGTGGFNAVGGITQPLSNRPISVFDTGAAPVPYPDAPGPGSFSPSPNYPGGSRGSSVFETGAPPVPYSPPPGSFSPSPNYNGGRDQIAQAMMPPAPNFNDTFSPFMRGSPTPTQMQNQPAIDEMLRFNGRGTGVAPDTPAAPPSPGADFNERFNIETSAVPGAPGSFADRFGFRNAGTPSEYTTAPYQDAGGTMRGPSQMPPGFSTPYSFDNPSGALGRGGFQGTQAPIMGASYDDEPSADTLTARDRAIGQGSGGFYPTPFNPGQFAPSSPFGSGAGVSAGRGSVMPPTATPFFGGEGSGFGAPGSMQQTGQRGFPKPGGYPALVGAGQDQYGNPFMQGNAPAYAQGARALGGGIGLGGLDALGQGTVFRGR